MKNLPFYILVSVLLSLILHVSLLICLERMSFPAPASMVSPPHRRDILPVNVKVQEFTLEELTKRESEQEEIKEILTKVQTDASADWKAFGEKLSGREIPEFDMSLYENEYTLAAGASRPETAPGKYFAAANAQKSMVTDRIFSSGNWLAGISRRVGEEITRSLTGKERGAS